jgi:hypothetical protein
MVPLIGDQYDGIFCLFLGNDLIDHGEGRGVARGSVRVTRRSCRNKLKPRDNPRLHGGPAPRIAFTTLREFGNDIGHHYL